MGKYKKFNETKKIIIFVNREVKIRWNTSNKNYFVGLGYEYTKMGDLFLCKINDLMPGCDKYVKAECPVCHRVVENAYNKIMRKGHSLCAGCHQKNDLTNLKFNRLTAVELDLSQDSQGTRWICRCDCGETVSVYRGHLVGWATKSCGCYHKDVSATMRGENSPYWNHDLSEKEREARRAYNPYQTWRTSVFERDSYTCRVCGCNKGGSLRGHHLFSYKKYKKLQLVTDNGLTMCVNCHNEFHRVYMGDTKIPCTIHDFIDWLNTKEKKPIELIDSLIKLSKRASLQF